MRTVVIGDTHGCYAEFIDLLKEIGIDFYTDRLVMLGDYIDRGTGIFEMLETIKLLRKDYGEEHVVLLRGNHEQMAIDAVGNGTCYWGNGCEKTLKCLGKCGQSIEDYIDLFKSLPLYFEDEHFICVHAGIVPGIEMAQQNPNDLLWMRDGFIKNTQLLEKLVIFGHTPTQMIDGSDVPIFMEGRIALDTGCVYGHNLSGLVIVDGEVTEINVHKKHGFRFKRG